MKKLFSLFGLFMVILTSCSDERDFGDTPFYQLPLNESDSITMVKIYKAMGCESWSQKNKIDFKRRIKWPGCEFEFDSVSKEFRVSSIRFDFYDEFPEFAEPEYNIPQEISQLPFLRDLLLFGREDLKINNIAALAGCPSLESLYINNGNFEGKDLNEELDGLSSPLKTITLKKSGLNGSQDWVKRFPELEGLNLSNNNYEGKVPDIYKYCDYYVDLSDNNYSEMEWSYFTDANVKRIPNLRYNKLHGEIPEDALNSPNWLAFRPYIYYQQKGYDYTNWDGR